VPEVRNGDDHRGGVGAGLLTAAAVRGADGELRCEGVPLRRIAAAAGTPVYVYNGHTIRDRYQRLQAALASVPHRLHYTLKANSSAAVLRVVRQLGAGVDVVSGGELHRARCAGFAGSDVVFGGVGKTDDELRAGLAAGVLLFNVESAGELRRLDAIAREVGVRAPIGLRINPEVSLEAAHAYIKTGERGQKFGIPWDDAIPVAELALSLGGVELVGLDMHLGSQLTRIDPYRAGVARLVDIWRQLRDLGVDTLRYLDIGGGLGVRYDTEASPDLDRFADMVLPLVRETGLTLLMEPGRFLVGNAGVLLTRVIDTKHSGGKDFVIVDAGMTELLRPSHYGAYHRVEPVAPPGEPSTIVDVVGPVCESGDFLALDRPLPPVADGDLIAILDVGAYGYVMASNYNSRPRAAEVLVEGDRFAVVTRRETVEDLVRLEIPDPDWRT
jgi:diaminopimelate decarboxylase